MPDQVDDWTLYAAHRARLELAATAPTGLFAVAESEDHLAILAGWQAIIDEDLEPLKIFLGAQTESLVSSIQSLVTSIRNEAGIVEVRGHIDAISFVVGKVVSSTEGTMSQEDLKRMGLNTQSGREGMLDRLGDCRRRLVELGERGDMKSLPGVAFEIARETKVSLPSSQPKTDR